MIRILLLAVVLSAAVSTIQGSGLLDTIGIILAAVFLATGISFINEYRSSREFDVLNAHRDEMTVKVIRDGRAALVPSRDIVTGDLIILEAGDAVPADGWLFMPDNLFCDESSFTGESEPHKKEDRSRMMKGTFVTAGRGGG